jgi:hypothetical protein
VKLPMVTVARWLSLAGLLLALGFVLSLSRFLFLAYFSILGMMIVTETIPIGLKGWQDLVRRRRPYRPRDTGAGRWLEAPVAELDKSTVGKLLASRASRDPGLHVVVSRNEPPVCSDALYDPELDG